VSSDIHKDILKLVVLERHKGTGRIGRVLFGVSACNEGLSLPQWLTIHTTSLPLAWKISICSLPSKKCGVWGAGWLPQRAGGFSTKAALGIGGLMSKEPLESLSAQIKALSLAAKSWLHSV